MNEPRVISLADRRPPPPGVAEGPARLHALLTELVQARGYWPGTQTDLVAVFKNRGFTVTDRTLREWLATPELRATIIVRRAAHGSTYYVVGPLPDQFRSTSDHGSDHGGPARARTSSSSSSALPEVLPISDLPASDLAPGLGEQYRDRLSAMRMDPKPWLLDALLEYPPAEVDEALDLMSIYAPKPPAYMLRTMETVHQQIATDAAAHRPHLPYVAPAAVAERVPEPPHTAPRPMVHPRPSRPASGMWRVLLRVLVRTAWRWLT